MDIANQFSWFNGYIKDKIIEWSTVTGWDFKDNWQNISLALLFSSSLVGIIFIFLIKKWKTKVLPEVKKLVGVGQSRPRFRKRDKVLFYGRKMLRKMRSISGQVKQGKKRKLVLKFANRILRLKKDSERPLTINTLEPPAEYLQEEQKEDQRVPPDAFYMLQSIRVFGHFEKPIFLKLCKHTDILNLPAGAYLFKVGDPDENVYVVQNGKVSVFVTSADGSTISLKVVKTGDSVTSLLSFTDVLTGHPHPYKTVSAKAVEDSTVVRLPMAAFQEVFTEYPDSFIRIMQVIMVRLQRVTFTALHQYLGLTSELIKPSKEKKKTGSPVKGGARWEAMLPSNIESFLVQSQVEDDCDLPLPKTKKSQSAFDLKVSHELKLHLLQQYEQRILEDHQYLHQDSNAQKLLHDHLQQQDLQQATDSNIKGVSMKKGIENLDSEVLKKLATEAFVRELGLEDSNMLEGNIDIKTVPPNTHLMRDDAHKDVALLYLLGGLLNVSQNSAEEEDEVHMFTAHPGEVVGGLAVLTGEPSFFSIRTKTAACVAMISKTTIYNILREKPEVVLHIAHTVVRRLSPFVRQVDFALDWVFLESGRAVYRQEDESDCTYIVLSGRLRSVITHSNGKKELVGEYGKGDLVGIVEMVTQSPRSTTVIAVRDSELAKLPEGLFNAIKLRFPTVVTRLINLLGHRIIGSWQNPTSGLGKVDNRSAHNNFSTVAIVPVSDDVPLSAFTYELYHSLTAIGLTKRLTSDIVRKELGVSAMDASQEYRLTSWLAQQEDAHRICLYQCDHGVTPWTQRCLRQADCVLIVVLGFKEPTIGKIELEIERLSIRTQKELVLLHKEGVERPNNTIEWLNMRQWISSHHHILCSKRMFSRRSQFRVNELYAKVLMSDPNIHSDFARLGRWLTGTSIGLVLGGGGAKGASHVGILKALEEAGIPIDMVGGVSIGAFIGALWCMHRDTATVTQKAREWSKKMNQWWTLLFDLTYPVTSMFTGRAFNRTIQGTFGETRIEDLWVPYFTLSTDITTSAMRVHRHGTLWRYVRASMSLSGYMPPLCDPVDGHLLLDGGYVNNLPGKIWTYVRASMSVAGVLPPMCDPVDGHLLTDGCYVNNVPADVMRSEGASHVIAIDVGSLDDTDLTNYGDYLSGWWVLWKRFYPFTSPVKVPNLPEIQSRLAYVSCVRQLEEVKASDYCEYIRPPIDKYKTLQFGSFDEIKEVGYSHGKAYFSEKTTIRPLARKYSIGQADALKKSPAQKSTYKFTDLAQMVCKVPTQKADGDSSSDYEGDEEYGQEGEGYASEMGYASEPSAHFLHRDSSKLLRRSGVSLSLSEPEPDSESELEREPKRSS
ncbi:neuropathy target esterase sws isoform X3 [Halyomorpha halys]|uniref:neuropathy target esterase sws isoform X3 n=1 Tax=Halyomorpha halys TaxID=286706 RepID=UPI000D0C81F7|nr:neuropathy target esterase sws isoform X3 [Halyomorpha halys]